MELDEMGLEIAQITAFTNGGAGIAAMRLHAGLLRQRQKSRLFVRHLPFDGVGVYPIDHNDVLAPILTDAWNDILTRQMDAGMLASIPYPSYGFSFLERFLSADVINLHWISGVISTEAIAELARTGKCIVWTLHDENPFTGFCHYRNGCDGYLSECENCPQALPPYRGLPQVMLGVKREFTPECVTVVAPSTWLAGIAQKSPVFRNNRVEIIPNSLDTSTYIPIDREKAKIALGVDPNEKIILCGAVSLNDPRKGFLYLAEALKIFAKSGKRATLVTFGELSIPADENIQFLNLGYISNDEKLALVYSASDVTVLPSLEDNLPNIMLESLACGTPIAAFNIGGVPDCVVDGKTGYLASKGDAHELAAAISKLLDRGPLMREHCRSYALEHYALDVQANAYIELYRDLICSNHLSNIKPPVMAQTAIDALSPLLTDKKPVSTHQEGEDHKIWLPLREKYIVFGTGIAGEEVFRWKISISYFIDNNTEKQGGEFMMLPVKPPYELFEEDSSTFFVIIASYDYSGEIAVQLENMGLVYGADFADFRKISFDI